MKAKICGWGEADAEVYRQCYDQFGGGVTTHPDVFDFIHKRIDCQPKYFAKYHPSLGLVGGICTWQGAANKRYLAWEPMARVDRSSYPFNVDEIVLPVSSEIKMFLPYSTKLLSSLNQASIKNVTYQHNSRRMVCLAKTLGEGGFSSKTKNSRDRDIKAFLNAGGEIKKVADFTAEELSSLYDRLFEIRRETPTNCPLLADVVRNLPEFFFGHVLLMDGKPCAYQLILMAESRNWIHFDFVNIVIDTAYPKLSIGTVVMWLNVKEAFLLCQSKNKEMRFSFGKNTGEYKNRWCTQLPIGRVLA